MAVLLVVNPDSRIYTRTVLHGINKSQSDTEYWDNLRLIAAVLLAQWSDTNPDLSGVRGHIFDVVVNEFFYHNGYAKTSFGEYDDRLWFCDYIGFEKITSQWAKENCPGCNGYLSMRLRNQNDKHRDVDNHTVLIYF